MEATISAAMNGCLGITDPAHPFEFHGRVEFFVERPLEIQFVFITPGQPDATWVVARQLVLDGLESTLQTGLGDFKARSTAKRFIAQLIDGGTGYWGTCSLPRDPILFVTSEAEKLAPIREIGLSFTDDELERWLS